MGFEYWGGYGDLWVVQQSNLVQRITEVSLLGCQASFHRHLVLIPCNFLFITQILIQFQASDEVYGDYLKDWNYESFPLSLGIVYWLPFQLNIMVETISLYRFFFLFFFPDDLQLFYRFWSDFCMFPTWTHLF